MVENWQTGGFGIYVHWPFCEAKCPYCDFNSHVAKFIDQDEWRTAYLAELDRYAQHTPDRVVKSVFFGGGTPSLMAPSTIEAIIDRIGSHWQFSNDVEVTLEANPGSVEAEKFADYRRAGINRVSLGVQALNDNDLRRLGRLHNTAEALTALEIARNTFDRASFDLIYARQDQSLRSWETELNQALTLGFSHISLYQLTIEQGTAFGDRYNRGLLKGLPSDDTSVDMYDLTVSMMAEAGLNRYEVSNFAVVGQESRHNLIYWNYGDYVGIGPGAHGRLSTQDGKRVATEAIANPYAWLKAVKSSTEQDKWGALTPEDQGAEMVLMGLRLKDGIDANRYKALTGEPLSPSGIEFLLEQGAIECRNERIVVTNQYVNVLNAVIEKLIVS